MHTLMREVDDLALSDVDIKQKTDSLRLTASMSNVKLSSADLSAASVDYEVFVGEEGPTCSENDTTLRFTFIGFEMTFSFNHWLEIAGSKVEEERGVGTFDITDATIVMDYKPYLSAERLRF